jgi:UDP-N-acetylmuramate dehydrogenase
MNIEHEVSLKDYNTFGIDVKASFMAGFTTIDELSGILSESTFNNIPKLVLGGGSNILFTKDFKGLVLKNNIPGIRIAEDRDHEVLVTAGAGVKWHSLVTWCIDKGFGGIENLSLIPGNTGAAPIQNIGAYGVELKDSFYSLEAYEYETGKIVSFSSDQCEFGYRDSIFKKAMKGKVIITSVTLSLSKTPVLHLTYGAIEQELKNMGVTSPDVKSVSDAVCAIRRSKLPDPVVTGNAGSFFKNPEITAAEFELLKKQFSGIVAYPLPGGNVKLAAGWLIEQCGWKGKVVGNTGSHKNQALVLVNYGHATGNEIWDLALKIQQSVSDKFGVLIEPEVNVM